MYRIAGALTLAVLVSLLINERSSAEPKDGVAPVVTRTPRVSLGPVQTTTLALDAHQRLGRAIQVDNLTVWPVLSDRTRDLGTYLTLQEALKKKQAIVREVQGRASQPPAANQPPGSNQAVRVQQRAGSGAQVNKLEIKNPGKLPILVPAGTILKGGKQDRQVGQDFVIPPNTTVPIDAFCVEKGRWTGVRDGRRTGGEFMVAGNYSLNSVRRSGQYSGDQAKVWKEVGAANVKMAKNPKTGTLLATMEDGDPEPKAYRAKVEAAVAAHLKRPTPKGWSLVGFAYAVDGKPLGVRTFLDPRLFVQHWPAYRSTITLEADIAQRAAMAAKKKPAPRKVHGADVLKLVQRLRKGKAETRNASGNRNVYVKSKEGGAARCQIQVARDGKKEWVSVSEDYTADD